MGASTRRACRETAGGQVLAAGILCGVRVLRGLPLQSDPGGTDGGG